MVNASDGGAHALFRQGAAVISLAVFVSGAMAMPVAAAEFAARYGISLAGLVVGKASLRGTAEGSAYSLELNAAMTGLAGAVSKGRGGASARGAFSPENVASNGFSLTATNGKDTRNIQITMSSGTVRNISIEPPFVDKSDGGDRIPLRDSHKVGVLDPASALVMPARGSDPFDKANCERRLSVFDGSQRFDVVLSYAGTRQVKADKGYAGPALVCSARYVPVAGHRPERRVVKFMAENREMDVWLVPAAGGKVLLPYRISVKTMIGTSVIEAEAFNPG